MSDLKVLRLTPGLEKLLMNEGITTVQALQRILEQEGSLRGFKGIGPGSNEQVRIALEHYAKREPTEWSYDTDLSKLDDLPPRVVNALRSRQVWTVGDALSRSKESLLAIRNMGPTSLQKLERALSRKGFSWPEE